MTKEMEENVEMIMSPIACVRDLGVFGNERRERHQRVREELHEAIQGIQELPDGYVFSFHAETSFLRIAEWITLESLCCPFFKIALELDPERRQIWVRLTGREGVKEFLELELGRGKEGPR